MAYIELPSIEKLEKKLGIEPDGVVQQVFTHTCRLLCDEFVPYDNGPLSENVTETSSSFTYESPYAEYQYFGERRDHTHKIVNRSRDMHELASSYWDRQMVSARGEEVVKQVVDEMRKRL